MKKNRNFSQILKLVLASILLWGVVCLPFELCNKTLFYCELINSDFANITVALLSVYLAIYALVLPYSKNMFDLTEKIQNEFDRINEESRKQQEEMNAISLAIKESGMNPELSDRIDAISHQAIKSSKDNCVFYNNIEIFEDFEYYKILSRISVVLLITSILIFTFRLSPLPYCIYLHICIYLFTFIIVYFCIIAIFSFKFVCKIISSISSLKKRPK